MGSWFPNQGSNPWLLHWKCGVSITGPAKSKVTILKWANAVAFSTFIVLWNQHLYLVLKHFHHSKVKPLIHYAVSPHPLSSTPDNHKFVFYLCRFTYSGILHKWDHIICDLLCWASFIWHVLQVLWILLYWRYLSSLMFYILSNLMHYVLRSLKYVLELSNISTL